MARDAIELVPDFALAWNSLGVALYRTGDFQAAIEALRKADAMPEVHDLPRRMFLAMAHWQLGDQEKARELYARGAAWIASHRENSEEHYRFRAEAEQLMGIDASGREMMIEKYLASSTDEEAEHEVQPQ